METYFSDQALAFLQAVALGGALGAVYDVFRILRIFRRRSPWLLVFFEDLLFSLIAAVATAYVLSRIYYGQVRLFLLVGQGLGFLIYHVTLGSLIGRIARLLARFFRFLAKYLRNFLKISKKPFIFLKKCCTIKLHHSERRKKRRDNPKRHNRKARQSKALP